VGLPDSLLPGVESLLSLHRRRARGWGTARGSRGTGTHARRRLRRDVRYRVAL